MTERRAYSLHELKYLQLAVMRDALAFYAQAQRMQRDKQRERGETAARLATQNADVADDLRHKVEARIEAHRRGDQ